MTEITRQELQEAHAFSLDKWSAPNKHFTSGYDPRTSENAQLSLMWGGLNHAQNNDWQNAGRRLIDKTYVQILFVTQGLAGIPFINADSTASALDNFIREQIAPNWSLINDTRQNNKMALAAELIDTASSSLFGSLKSEHVASHLLFYLCPTLPVIPLTQEGSYSSHSESSLQDMKSHQTYLDGFETPKADFGHSDVITLVNSILNETNWWHRNVFKTALSNPSL